MKTSLACFHLTLICLATGISFLICLFFSFLSIPFTWIPETDSWAVIHIVVLPCRFPMGSYGLGRIPTSVNMKPPKIPSTASLGRGSEGNLGGGENFPPCFPTQRPVFCFTFLLSGFCYYYYYSYTFILRYPY